MPTNQTETQTEKTQRVVSPKPGDDLALGARVVTALVLWVCCDMRAEKYWGLGADSFHAELVLGGTGTDCRGWTLRLCCHIPCAMSPRHSPSYPANWMHLPLTVFVGSLGFSAYKIIASVKRHNFTSFPIWMPFVSFSCLIALSRTSRTR